MTGPTASGVDAPRAARTGNSTGDLADKLLARLGGVRSTAQDRWLACCPAHEDRSPSLSIREVEDRVLLHCFGGCSVHDVLNAVGFEISDLFPARKPVEGNRKMFRPFPAADILRALNSEITFIALCASDVAKGEKLKPEEIMRLFTSGGRFRAALEAGGMR